MASSDLRGAVASLVFQAGILAVRELLDESAQHMDALLPPVAASVPRALPPASRRGRRPGPKPVKARPAEASRAPVSGDADLTGKVCRKCHKKGTARRLHAGERAVRCSACGFQWDARGKYRKGETGVTTPRPKHPRAAAEPGTCRRCDHDTSAHPGGEQCLVPRCVCKELIA